MPWATTPRAKTSASAPGQRAVGVQRVVERAQRALHAQPGRERGAAAQQRLQSQREERDGGERRRRRRTPSPSATAVPRPMPVPPASAPAAASAPSAARPTTRSTSTDETASAGAPVRRVRSIARTASPPTAVGRIWPSRSAIEIGLEEPPEAGLAAPDARRSSRCQRSAMTPVATTLMAIAAPNHAGLVSRRALPMRCRSACQSTAAISPTESATCSASRAAPGHRVKCACRRRTAATTSSTSESEWAGESGSESTSAPAALGHRQRRGRVRGAEVGQIVHRQEVQARCRCPPRRAPPRRRRGRRPRRRARCARRRCASRARRRLRAGARAA